MSLALVTQKLLVGIEARNTDPTKAKELLGTAFKFSSEKLGVFTLPTCACLTAKAAFDLEQGESQAAQDALKQCNLDLEGVLGDHRVELLRTACQFALTTLQDLQGNKLDDSCFNQLSDYQANEQVMNNLAKQFACQLFKAKIIFDQQATPETLQLVKPHLSSEPGHNTLIFEALMLLATNDCKSSQTILEQIIFELEDGQADKQQLLLPVLILSYCHSMQSRPESALTYVYWVADLAAEVYALESSEYIELQLFAAYFANTYDSQNVAEKYFAKIIDNADANTTPAEFLLACFELQQIKATRSFDFGTKGNVQTAAEQAYFQLFENTLTPDFNWHTNQQANDTTQACYDKLQDIKARYNGDFNPQLLLIIDRMQRQAASNYLFMLASSSCG